MAPTPRGKPNMDTSSLYDNPRFSDMVIKFSDREIQAHRFVLCTVTYFDKMCGPDSPFAEAKEAEVTLLGDDPDAAEAVLRHLYNFTLEPPDDEESDKVRFYANFVVAADKYGVLALAEEAALYLTSHLVNTKAAQDVVTSLKIIAEEYRDYESLQLCAASQLKCRLKELASVPDLAALVGSQPLLFTEIVAQAVKLADLSFHQCHFCRNVILRTGGAQPVCCKNRAGSIATTSVIKQSNGNRERAEQEDASCPMTAVITAEENGPHKQRSRIRTEDFLNRGCWGVCG